MCVRVCNKTSNPAGSILGAYFLLCTVVCLLSATSLQVTHAHNEQCHHTSTGCQATCKTLTDSAEMESDSNLARKTEAAGKHHFDRLSQISQAAGVTRTFQLETKHECGSQSALFGSCHIKDKPVTVIVAGK